MRSIDIIGRFVGHYPQVKFPQEFLDFVERQDETGHQIRRIDTGKPLSRFLEDLGVSHDSIACFLDANSTVVLKTNYPSLLLSSPNALDAYLAKHFSVIFDLQQIALDSQTLTGFNRHGREHLRRVTRSMLKLLHSVPSSIDRPQKVNEAIIAGYLHDIGNLVARKDHGLYAIYLLTQLFIDIDHDRVTLSSFLRIMESVLFHEVEFGSRLQSLKVLNPVTLSLIVADKTDVSFRRVSAKSNSNASEAISDAHMLVNLLSAESKIFTRRKAFQWEIHFSPKASHDQANLFPELLKRAERVWVPQEWQELYRQGNIEYVFIFNATFLRVYFSRLFFMIRAIFAFSSSIEEFQLVIDDDERGISLKRIFTRKDYQDKINMIGRNLFKNSWEQTSNTELRGNTQSPKSSNTTVSLS